MQSQTCQVATKAEVLMPKHQKRKTAIYQVAAFIFAVAYTLATRAELPFADT